MKVKHLLIALFTLILFNKSFCQNNVGIGTSTPEPRSILDLSSTDKGFLAPRMSKAQRLKIDTTNTPSNIIGLIVYDLDDKNYVFFNGVKWVGVAANSIITQTNINAGVNNKNPENRALLDLTSTDKGLLMPRLTTSQRLLIDTTTNAGNIAGLIVYDLTSKGYWFFNGVKWLELSVSANSIITQTAINAGVNNTTPETRALLDLSSTDKGLLIPRLTTAQRLLIDTTTNAGNIAGLIVYDLTSKGYWFFNGVKWLELSVSANSIITQTAINAGVNNTTPETRALLDLKSTDKGLLMPRLTKAQRQLIDTVTNPNQIIGLTVFDTDDKNYWFFDGIKWIRIMSEMILSQTNTNIGIGNKSPENRSILDMTSTSKGVLMPRMTTIQRQAIDTVTNAANIKGLVVYDLTDKNYWFFDGTKWNSMKSAAAPVVLPQKWSAIGTTDISTNSLLFTPMSDMTLTFTPNTNKVYLTFSASGDVSIGASPYPQWVIFRCKVNGTVVCGTNTMTTDLDNFERAAAWNSSLSIPISVNIGTPNTITIEWKTEDTSGGIPGNLKNSCSTGSDYSHRSLIIAE